MRTRGSDFVPFDVYEGGPISILSLQEKNDNFEKVAIYFAT